MFFVLDRMGNLMHCYATIDNRNNIARQRLENLDKNWRTLHSTGPYLATQNKTLKKI